MDDEIIGQIHDEESLEGVPVVAVSEERPLHQWRSRWKVDNYLLTPVSVYEMLDALSIWLSNASQEEVS